VAKNYVEKRKSIGQERTTNVNPTNKTNTVRELDLNEQTLAHRRGGETTLDSNLPT